MNSSFLLNIFRFFAFLALQVLIFNNIDFYGYLNPFIYILFIILYPVNDNKLILLIMSFLLGLTLDAFANSGGIHATAAIIIAYSRPTILKFSFGVSYEYQTIKITDKINSERIVLILLTVFIHHFIIYSLELFGYGLFLDFIPKIILNTLFTSLICVLTLYLIKPNKR